MKKIIGVLGALVLAVALHAQPTFDGGAVWSNASSGTFNNTGVSDTYLVVGVYTTGASVGSILELSYGGTDLSQQTAAGGTTSSNYMFTLANPATGSNTWNITFNVAPTNYYVVVTAYDGVTGIGNTTYAYPAPNTSMTYGSIGGGGLGVYFGGNYGSAPTIADASLTSRESLSSGTSVYLFGDTGATGAQTFTGTDVVGYQLAGTMVELQGAATATITTTYTTTPTASPTATATPTASPTTTDTPTITRTSTISPTSTASPTITGTPTITKTSTISPTVTLTATPTASPTPTLTDTLTSTVTPTVTPTAVNLPYNSQGQFQSEAVPYTNGWTSTNLPTSTAWTATASGCLRQPCEIFIGNPSTTPANYYFYWESPNATQTPTTNGLPLAPGAVAKLWGAVNETVWGKAAVTATTAPAMEVKQ